MSSQGHTEPGAHRPLRILSLSCVYPTTSEPDRGQFVRSRLLAVAGFVQLHVVAPMGIIQWGSSGKQRFGTLNPWRRTDGGVDVLHPRWLYPPNAGWLNGFLLFLQLFPVLVWLRRRFPWEILDAHYGHPEGVAAALCAIVFRCRYTVTVRGAELWHARYHLRRRVLSWALRRADRVIALSRELRELAVELGVHRDRVALVLNGVDGARFRLRPREESRRRLGLDQNLRIVLSAGRLVKGKGHLQLLEAVRRLLVADPGLRLVTAGGAGREEPMFERELRRRSNLPEWRGKLILLGQIPQDDLAEWMNAADLFALGSLREGCPNVVREALACGLPVVATRVGAIPELIPSDEFGLLVSPGDPAELESALRRALARNWDRETIAAWGRSHSWQHVAEELWTVFQDVCAESSAGRQGAGWTSL